MWALAFVLLAFGMCVQLGLGLCAQDTPNGKGRLLAALGNFQFWIMNVLILHSMRTIWRPLSRGGGAITELAPQGVQIHADDKKHLDRMWRVYLTLSFLAVPWIGLFATGTGEIYAMLEDSDPEGTFRNVSRTNLGFLGAHAAAWLPGCYDVGTVRVLARLYQATSMGVMVVFGPLVAGLLCCIAYMSAIVQSEIRQLNKQLDNAADLDDKAWEEKVRQPVLRLAQKTMPALNRLASPIELFVVGYFAITPCFMSFTVQNTGGGGNGGINDYVNFNFFGACES